MPAPGSARPVAGRRPRARARPRPGRPAPPPPVLAAATGPRSLRLSGELADGTILTASTGPAQVREARRLVDEGREIGGRTGPHPLIVYLLTATGAGAAHRLHAERPPDGDHPRPPIDAAPSP